MTPNLMQSSKVQVFYSVRGNKMADIASMRRDGSGLILNTTDWPLPKPSISITPSSLFENAIRLDTIEVIGNFTSLSVTVYGKTDNGSGYYVDLVSSTFSDVIQSSYSGVNISLNDSTWENSTVDSVTIFDIKSTNGDFVSLALRLLGCVNDTGE